MFASGTKFLIIGGDRLLRDGVARILLEQGATSHSLDRLADLQPDSTILAESKLVILLDWLRGDQAFLDGFRRLRSAAPNTHVVVLAGQADRHEATEAVAAGVDGFILRDASAEALVQALKLVMLGGGAYSGRIISDILTPATPGPSLPTTGRHALTEQQINLLNCLTRGYSNKIIANNMNTTEATVKVQVRHLLKKLGVVNRTQAAIWALNQNLGRPTAP